MWGSCKQSLLAYMWKRHCASHAPVAVITCAASSTVCNSVAASEHMVSDQAPYLADKLTCISKAIPVAGIQ